MTLEQLRGAGPSMIKHLHRLGIKTITDLLYHFPVKYHDYSTITLLSDCALDTPVTIAGTVTKITQRRSWKRRRFTLVTAIVQDETGTVTVTWFNQPYIVQNLPVGSQVYLSGKITEDKKYGLQLKNPIYEKNKPDTLHTARIVPHYPLTTGITQKQLRYFMSQALQFAHTASDLEWLPNHILEQHDLPNLLTTLQLIHFPDTFTDIKLAKYRLGFDELLLVYLFIQTTKNALAHEQAYPIPFKQALIKEFVSHLPFQLTIGQKQAAWQIIQDLEHPTPMNRLLEGDVGSGKTAVASIAMYHVAQAGLQAVLLAPTEILAQQHYETITQLLRNTGVKVGLWTASTKTTNLAQAPKSPKGDFPNTVPPLGGEGAGEVLIGTHALLQKNLQFNNLALVIIDEQHRFGVKQRQHLQQVSGQQRFTPHLLSMTATPIPRSLALTLYGDLELSILNQLPAGRKPIITQLITAEQRSQMYAQIQQHITAGEQVYVVAPRIDEVETHSNASLPKDEKQPENAEVKSVKQEYENLKKIFSTARIALLHGKLKSDEKQAVMAKFTAGEIDILVATTVIEVGVNVPNATVIVIEGAEQFGLAQLHQLRGRVGRADKQSYCFVCGANDRLNYFAQTRDGFALAEYDLAKRGPGDVYGQNQSGFLTHFKMAKLNNAKQLQLVKQVGQDLFAQLSIYPKTQQHLQHFIEQVHLE